MELYSREFWKARARVPSDNDVLASNIDARINLHREVIAAWCAGKNIECKIAVWEIMARPTCSFPLDVEFRVAPPPNTTSAAVVYWADERNSPSYVAGVYAERMWPENHPLHKTAMAQLADRIPGFKLLAITHVVTDPDHNLLEYSTKLDNLGRVPF